MEWNLEETKVLIEFKKISIAYSQRFITHFHL